MVWGGQEKFEYQFGGRLIWYGIDKDDDENTISQSLISVDIFDNYERYRKNSDHTYDNLEVC